MFNEYIKKTVNRINLSLDEARNAMDDIMKGSVDDMSISAFLVALRMKGETSDELAGFALSMIGNAEKFEKDGFYLDTCGTGGDGKGTINISTISAVIAASAGVKVAKHGNRAVSGRCGSADVLEALGIDISLEPDETKAQISTTGFGFLFAPLYHKAIKHAMPARKALGIPTVFNMLGPLSNPASVDAQMLGVFRKDLVRPLADVLGKIGVKRGLVIHGLDGSDEISVYSKSLIAELKDGEIMEYMYSPRKLYNDAGEIKGGDTAACAHAFEEILSNRINGAAREIVLQNAGAAIYISGIASSIMEGISISEEILRSKAGVDKINEVLKVQKEIKGRRNKNVS